MGRTIMVPIRSMQEADKPMLDYLRQEAEQVVLCFVVDKQTEATSVTSISSKINKAEDVMDDISKKLKKRVTVRVHSEWGAPYQKLYNIAKLAKADEIAFYKANSAEDLELIRQLAKDFNVKTLN